MNKIINIILSGLLWRKYKFFILSLILLIAFIFVVGQVHLDYLRFNDRQETPGNVGLSFAVKWAVWALSIVVFLMANHFFNKHKKHQKELESEQSNSALKKILQWKSSLSSSENSEERKAQKLPNEELGEATESSSDPFAAIRKKDKLRSYADVIIEQKPTKKN
ncbi:hypothetical protein ISG33_07735 [Glaciecola sp. MH2013]|uniref:hypothetical protein n=1 Tax=Glaciecola sp. MH2013 TaxID=2785524 RepID=UPI0018A0649C|nr:hypothetical protein [Glaciecola sp. MH2013]MBF7073284.1 hypothetical protein [Glaciecola sp. MH2013]